MTAYYNEIDPFAAAWLRQLIAEGHIAPGIVDERSILDVHPKDLDGFTQCHFFAGIGVWSYALRRAGWPDNRPVWTGSCPCQPFSAAGKGAGFTDERHLWPAWFHLISQHQPVHIFGEQVASKDGLGWLDLVQTDMDGAGYASGAVDLCAAGVGAPHIRQRLWFVAERLGDTSATGLSARECETLAGTWRREEGGAVEQRGSAPDRMAFPDGAGQCSQCGEFGQSEQTRVQGSTESGAAGWVAYSNSTTRRKNPRGSPSNENEDGCEGRYGFQSESDNRPASDGEIYPTGPTIGFWRDADWLFCRDGKWRPVEPGTFPLVDGTPARVGRLRGFGNAINAEAAVAFIESAIDSLDNSRIY